MLRIIPGTAPADTAEATQLQRFCDLVYMGHALLCKLREQHHWGRFRLTIARIRERHLKGTRTPQALLQHP